MSEELRQMLTKALAETDDAKQQLHEAVAAMREAMEQVKRERDEARAALQWIRDNCGKVCEKYEICGHVSCQSSVAAWFMAGETLNPSMYAEPEGGE